MAWVLTFALAICCALLLLKIYFLHRDVDEILLELHELISEDTNLLITVSGGDKTLRRLASELNKELRELKRLRRKFINGDREIKDAVTNISHDLRTPVTAICGYLELLKNEEKSPAAERYIKNIENRTEAMKKLTEELFRYSVILSTSEDMDFEPVDLGAALEESAAGFYGALTGRGIEPIIEIPEEKIIRSLNRDALSRIFGNIISNAIKYSDGDLEIKLSASGTVTFRNTAIDLREVDVGKLFDRFFSVEAARNSTGLGLAISKTLVEHMGGSISADYDGRMLGITVSFPAGEGISESVG